MQLLRALPYPAADRLYRLDYAEPGQDWPDNLERLDWRATDDVVEHLHLVGPRRVLHARRAGHAHAVRSGAWIDARLHPRPGRQGRGGPDAGRPRLSARRAAGRGDQPRAVAVEVSRRLGRCWPETFRAYVSDRPDEAETFTIVGVLPPGFWHVNTYSEVLAPLRAPTYPYLVRVRAGVSRDVAADRLSSFVRAGLHAARDLAHAGDVTSRELRRHGSSDARRDRRRCRAGAGHRGGECGGAAARARTATREGYWPSGWRLARATPSRPAARRSKALLVGGRDGGRPRRQRGSRCGRLRRQIEQLSRPSRARAVIGAVAIDGTVLAIGLGCGLLVTLVFTLSAARLSAWLATLVRPAGPARRNGLARPATCAVRAHRRRGGRVDHPAGRRRADAAERAQHAACGFRGGRIAGRHFQPDAAAAVVPDAASRTTFFERLSAQLSGVAGSTSVALGDYWPLQTRSASRVHTSAPARVEAAASVIRVTSGYFDTIGMALLDGRHFTARDTAGADPVVIVSAALAERLWPGARAVGQSLSIAGEDASGPARIRQVIGVVGDVRQTHTDTDQLDASTCRSSRSRAGLPSSMFAICQLRHGKPICARRSPPSTRRSRSVRPAGSTPRSSRSARGRASWRGYSPSIPSRPAGWRSSACTASSRTRCGSARKKSRSGWRSAPTPQRSSKLSLRQGAIVIAGGVLVGSWGAVALGRVLEGYLHGVRPAEPGLLGSRCSRVRCDRARGHLEAGASRGEHERRDGAQE